MNANRLELLTMGLMIPNHISCSTPPEQAPIFHITAHCVGASFDYMAAEGFNYTRNVYHYNGRLYIWTAIMFVGNTLLNYLVNNLAVTVHNNILFILALGVSMLVVTEAMLEVPKTSLKTVLLISTLTILGIGAVFAGGGIVMLPFTLITCSARRRLALRNCLCGVLALFFLVTSFQWLGD